MGLAAVDSATVDELATDIARVEKAGAVDACSEEARPRVEDDGVTAVSDIDVVEGVGEVGSSDDAVAAAIVTSVASSPHPFADIAEEATG